MSRSDLSRLAPAEQSAGAGEVGSPFPPADRIRDAHGFAEEEVACVSLLASWVLNVSQCFRTSIALSSWISLIFLPPAAPSAGNSPLPVGGVTVSPLEAGAAFNPLPCPFWK